MLLNTYGELAACAVDEGTQLPRYWAEVWANWFRASHTPNSLKTNLRHIDSFHRWCDARSGKFALDNALGEKAAVVVHQMVEDFYLALAGSLQRNTTDVQMWGAVKAFVLHYTRAWGSGATGWRELQYDIQRMPRIHANRGPRVKFTRALPGLTLRELYAASHPKSPSNPFKSPHVRERNWLLLRLFLENGLRRGEVMLLTVDAVRHDVDDTGEIAYWLAVTNTQDDEFDAIDERTTRPGIKTVTSHRALPISPEFAALCATYVESFRADSDEHAFLFTANSGRPLSAEAISATFARLTAALSAEAQSTFRRICGGKRRISPHDLRHTSATARYAAFAARDNDKGLTLQRMRAFYGWSPESSMPDLYARTAIQDDLRLAWKEIFLRDLGVLRGVIA